MTQSFLLITYRKPGLTMAEFIHHYENVHIPLIKQISGSTFPSRHVRHYVERKPDGPAQAGDQRNVDTPTTLLHGDIKLMDWDCLSELEFRDNAHSREFFAIVGSGKGKVEREADERKFLDCERIVSVKAMGRFETTNRSRL